MIRSITFLNIAFLLALYWIGYIYQAFLLDIVIAALLSLATSGTHYKFVNYINRGYSHISSKQRNIAPLFASIIMTSFLAALLFAPLIYFIYKTASIVNTDEIGNVITHIKAFGINWVNTSELIPSSVKLEISDYMLNIREDDYLKNSLALLRDWSGEVMKFIVNSALILVFYFFANLYGREILMFIRKLLPLNDVGKQMILGQISQTMSVVMYSTVFVAILEGILFAIGALWLGYDPFFWGIAYAFASLIPIVGGAIIWVPLAAYEISLGSSDNALFIAIYTIIVNSIVADTFLKPIIIDFINKKFTKRNLNPTDESGNSLIIFFAIIAGMSVYGFWGIILGPAATSLFISLLKIYDKLAKNELNENNSP